MRTLSLTSEDMQPIYSGWVSDKKKVEKIAKLDGKSPKKVACNIITGMSGELCGYIDFTDKLGFECEPPDFGVRERNSEIWDKDLVCFEPVPFIRNGKQMLASELVSCKAQMRSQTYSINDEYPSWTFQLPEGRRGDPILKQPNANKILMVAWVDDYEDYDKKKIVDHLDPPDDFVWKVKIKYFWWPDVFPFLDKPRLSFLAKKKRVLYYSDIKHLEIAVCSGSGVCYV